VRDLRPRLGEGLLLYGNTDVRMLAGTREELEAEILGKLPAAMASGGYLFAADHSVPNDVSLENFRFAMELIRRHGVYD